MMDCDMFWFVFLYVFSIQDVRAQEECLSYGDFYSECLPLIVDHATVCYTKKDSFLAHYLTANITCNEGYKLDKQIKPVCGINRDLLYIWITDIPKCEAVPTTMKPSSSDSDKQDGASVAAYVVPVVVIILVLVAIAIALLYWRRNRVTTEQRSGENSKIGHMTVNNQLYDDTTEIISDVTLSMRNDTISGIQTANGDNDEDSVGYDYENVRKPIPNGKNKAGLNHSEQRNNNDVTEPTESQNYDSDYENAFT